MSWLARTLLGTLLAAVVSTASVSAAGASPAAAGHMFSHRGHEPGGGGSGSGPGGGAPGWGHHRQRSVEVSGTAGAVSQSGFSLQLPASRRASLTATSTTIAVTVTDSTKYFEPGQSGAGIQGVLDGDSVEVTGMATGPGAITARSVMVPLARDTGAVGPVVTSTGFSLTLAQWPSELTGTSTSVTVTLTAQTDYVEPGQSSPGLQGVLPGDSVVVAGVQGGTQAVTATVVRVPLAQYSGAVSDLSSGGFTLTAGNGTSVAVTLTSGTQLKQRGNASPTLANGDAVRVVGTQGGSDAVTALAVTIVPSGHPFPGAQGGGGAGGGPGHRGHGHHGPAGRG
ncbi:MAG TPA: DUF5666 domain-containing protein [Acidimicrobiales bacterium]|nr:DUF5666 domain-containing protein [Acidimicrobiales bacterium]